MFYLLRRTWPSLLRTTLVCGTICYGLTLAATHTEAPPKSPAVDMEMVSVNIARHEQALQRMVEIRPELAPALAEIYGEPVSVIMEDGKPVVHYVAR